MINGVIAHFEGKENPISLVFQLEIDGGNYPDNFNFRGIYIPIVNRKKSLSCNPDFPNS